jgi:hypothetical protein
MGIHLIHQPTHRSADRDDCGVPESAMEQSALGERPRQQGVGSTAPGISKAVLAGGCQSPSRKTRDRKEKKQSRIRQQQERGSERLVNYFK